MTRRDWMLAVSAAFPAIAQQPESGFTSLFNGKDLAGWVLMRPHGPGYVVEDGILVCPAEGGGNLYSEKDYADFVLRLEFRFWEGANNGVGIRAPLEGDAAYAGMEIQVLDDEAEVYQRMPIKPTQYTGAVYDVFAAKPGYVKRNGVWNEYEIMADGRRIKVTLNGVVITDANLDDVKDPAKLKRHPGLARKSGRVGFLGHGTRVEFRNIRIKTLR